MVALKRKDGLTSFQNSLSVVKGRREGLRVEARKTARRETMPHSLYKNYKVIVNTCTRIMSTGYLSLCRFGPW